MTRAGGVTKLRSMNLSDPVRFRRALTATSLLLAGLLISVGVISSPPQGDDRGEYLASLAAHAGATQASALLLHFGFLLLVPGAIGLLALLQRRAVALGHVAVALAVVGAITLAGNVVTDIYDLALAQNLPADEARTVSEAAESYGAAAPLIVPGYLGTVFGFVMLAVALWRAGWVRGWLPLLTGLGFMAFAVVTPVGAVVLAGVFGFLGLTAARTTEAQWTGSAAAG